MKQKKVHNMQSRSKYHYRKGPPFLENIVFIAIILVLGYTVIQDVAILQNWKWETRTILIYIGFLFDLFFVIEFLVRAYYAVLDRKLGQYILKERGWVDFIASVPLLLFSSGPEMYGLLTGAGFAVGIGGVISVLKVVKAVRVARILRLLRILKIFKRIRNTDSVMAQRHVAKITTIATTSIIFTLVGISIISSFINIPALDEQITENNFYTMQYGIDSLDSEEEIAQFAEGHPYVLLIRDAETTYYSRYPDSFYESYFGPEDYLYFGVGEYHIFLDRRSIAAQEARDNIIHFIIIVILTIVFVFYYSPHFALTITDPIHIMRRGFNEKEYNLEIKISPHYTDDDIYRLACLYNEIYLPLKDRTGGSGIRSLVEIDSLDDILKRT